MKPRFARYSATNLMTIGDWCITKDPIHPGKGIFADHIVNCHYDSVPVKVGDVCWAHNDTPNDNGEATCYYCDGAVPPEIQALVLLQMKL